MKQTFKKFSLMLALVMVFSVFSPAAALWADEGTTKTVTILATSDLHGRIYPYEYAIDSADDDAGFGLIQTLVKQEKALNPNAILVDNGDTLQDNMAELFNDQPVHPMVEAMNYMGYDVFNLGNHEFNFGLDFLNKNIAAFEGTVISSNIYKEDGTRFVDGYAIIERDGVRVAIVGMTPPSIPRWEASNPAHFKGLTFNDPVEEAKKVVKELEGKYDVLIGLMHLSYDPEYFETDGVEPIAEACPEFDAIVAGHAHSLFDNKEVNGVKVIEPGRWGAALAKIEVKVEKSGDAYVVKEVTTKNLSTKGLKADQELLDKFKYVHDTSLAEANKVVGEVTANFIDRVDYITGAAKVTTMPTAQIKDNAVIDLINEVQKFYAGAEISTAALFTNDSNLVAGPFKKKDVAFIYKYDNTLMGVNITGKNLKAYMEWSANYYNTYNEGDLTVSFNKDVRGYNYDMFSGINYQVDISKPSGSRIVNLTFNGKPIEDDKVYKMAVNNYRFGTLISNGWATLEDKYYDSYATYGDGGRVRDLIIKYVQEQKGGKVVPTVDNNWKIVGANINHPHLGSLKTLVEAGLVSIPRSEDGRTPNVRSLTLNELYEQGFLTKPYIVKEGDVLWKIGRKYGFTWKELADYNSIVKPNLIMPGQEIFIPLKRIDVLSTNDFHGAVEGSSSNPGAAKLAAYVNYYKAMNPNGTLVLDGGDAFQGTPISNVHRGKPVVEMMGAIGYDAMVVGNHEFDWGIEAALESLKLDKDIALLAANIYENGKPVNWAKPYAIVEKNGIKVGIIGLSTPETAITAHADYVGNFEFKDPVEVANALIPEVKKAGAEVIVLLTHIPGMQDSKTKEVTGALADLAKGVTGAHVIVGGHSHKTVYGMINGAAVIEAYYNGRNLGYATVVYDPVAKKVLGAGASTIDVAKGKLAVTPVAEVQAIVDKYNEELKPIFGEVIGKTAVELKRDYNNESILGNWSADVMRKKAGVQIAMQNAGGLRCDIAAGDITVGTIFTFMPFDNTLVTAEMTGAQIKAVMEQSVTLYKGMMQVSGIKVTYDSTQAEGSRVIEMTLTDGTAIEMDKTYTVCTNDFLSGGQDGFVTLKEVKWTNTYILIRDALIEDVKANGGINAEVEGRMTDISKATSYVDNRIAA
ncbi:MAG: 5'-nucleotidase C-terminal domain-containing protein [Bacillota bacterium]